MNPVPFQTVPPQWFPMLPPNLPMSSAFWESKNVQERLRELQDTLDLAKAMYVPNRIQIFLLILKVLVSYLLAIHVHFVCYYDILHYTKLIPFMMIELLFLIGKKS